MLQHIIDFARSIADPAPGQEPNRMPGTQPAKQLCRELDTLSLIDFEPEARYPLMRVRAHLAHFAETTGWSGNVFKQTVADLIPLLSKYRGVGSSAVKRQFAYLSRAPLRRIIERDYGELTLKLFPSGAWKSTVVMAGSILESILFDVLSDPNRVVATMASTKCLRKSGAAIDMRTEPDNWKLFHLIQVATDTAVLSADRADTIDTVLRDYRNFVHPHVELRSKHECREAEAGLARYGLDGVCDHLERTLGTSIL